MDFEKSRMERLEVLRQKLNNEKVEERCNGLECSKFIDYGRGIKIENMAIGYIRPKNDIPSVDFYEGNIQVVTIDIEVEKDLNNENLDLRINNGTFDLVDMETLDIEEYVRDMLDGFDRDSLYDLLEYYDCSPSDLAQCYIENNEIEEIVGDLYIQYLIDKDEEDKQFGIKWSSFMDIESIIKDLREDEQLVLFDNAVSIIDELKKMKYSPFEETKDLTMEDMEKIADLINKLVNDDFKGDKVAQYILNEVVYNEEE